MASPERERTLAEYPIVVVGAGITGLSAAYRLSRAGLPVVVLEAKDRPGGNILTARHDGFVYDLGPDSFLKSKPAGKNLCVDLGLESEIISPKPGATLVHVARAGQLHPMPEGLSLGVPKRAGPLLGTPLLSFPAKLRAMMEPFVSSRPADVGEETIHDFLARRLGEQMAERLAAPLLSGVFAGDARRLSIDAAFPQLVALEKKYGSLFSGLNGGKSLFKVLSEDAPAPQSPFMSLRGGLSDLVDALLSQIPENTVRLSSPVRGVTPPEAQGEPVRVQIDGEELSASQVIVAGPPWTARPLLAELGAEFEQALGQINGFSTATVFFGLNAKQAEASFAGSGFIVPPGEAEILASTFISSKWEARAPDGSVLIRAFVGGSRQDITLQSDDDLEEVAQRELTRFLGELGNIQFSRVYRYDKGSPQPELGYSALLERINQAVRARPWLSLIGSGYGGAGIPDCIRQADEVSARLIEERR